MKKIFSMIALAVLMVALAGSCTKNLEERLDKADADLASVRTAIGQYEKLQSDITSVVQSLQNEVGSRPASEQKTVWACIAALQSQNNTVSTAISALNALVGEESVSDQIAEALAELTDSYDLDNLEATLQALKAEVAEKFDVKLLESKVENLSKTIRNFDYYLAKLTEIEGMLQSVSIIPAYSNGSVKAEDGNLEMRCIVTPASILSDISNLKECFTLTVDSLSTRAGDGEIPVTTAKVEDKDLGIVKITADLSAYLPGDETKALIFSLIFRTGNTRLTTDFVEANYRWMPKCDSYQEAEASLQKGVYSYMGPVNGDSWGSRPQTLLGGCSTMDVASSGSNEAWVNGTWDRNDKDVVATYKHSYKAIDNANKFLTAISDKSFEGKDKLAAEARALRGFHYFQLAETFGKIHIVRNSISTELCGTDVSVDDYEKVWDYIIEDFTAAAQNLDWELAAGSDEKCTKGMALSYLGEAYMWKAYRCPEKARECYEKAKPVFKRVIEEGPYCLAESYSTLWDNVEWIPEIGGWNKETIWQTTVGNGEMEYPSRILDGEPVMNLTWELFSSFEPGDKRRDASMCAANVRKGVQDTANFHIDSKYAGVNVFCKQNLTPPYDNFYYQDGADYLPAVWGLKNWRVRSAQAQDAPTTIYWMRYANVLLDYAECCFRTWDEATGWTFLDGLRERAFGNLEVGPDLSKYLTSYMKENGHTEYPIDFSNEVIYFPSAKEYYTLFKADKGFKSEAWMVALNMERVKEFSGEPCLRAALQCSGFLEDYINTVYPKNTLEPSDLSCPWVKRNFDYNGEAWEKGVPVPVITNTF